MTRRGIVGGGGGGEAECKKGVRGELSNAGERLLLFRSKTHRSRDSKGKVSFRKEKRCVVSGIARTMIVYILMIMIERLSNRLNKFPDRSLCRPSWYTKDKKNASFLPFRSAKNSSAEPISKR